MTSSLPNGMGHKSYIFYDADIGCAAGIPGKPRDNPGRSLAVPCCGERQISVSCPYRGTKNIVGCHSYLRDSFS